MIKEIIVAGVKLHNYSVLENLTQIAKNLEANVFTTIEEVYMKTILLAKEDESVRETIESMDVTVIAETGILEAVGQGTILRKTEIERREFFFQLMKVFERNGYTVYILGQERKEVTDACQKLAEDFPRMKVVGSTALTEIDGVEAGVINDINMIAPDVILSVLPSPIQENFLKEYRSMILAKIWYGIGAEKIAGARLTLAAKITKFLRKLTFKRFVKEEIEQVEEAQKKVQLEEIESRESEEE